MMCKECTNTIGKLLYLSESEVVGREVHIIKEALVFSFCSSVSSVSGKAIIIHETKQLLSI